ncbi:sensor histidine kinase [Paenibacillus sp. PAMC21692]|uniref:sensor histidine kinase n=1 Tax=Paenibacillus sp. PAMC21692 TaxID=2762320 RepID=UPI00164DD71C|nr:histidine kinase [Paenibacillus sp. PAMC21692]QNK57904.1 histidine kinase [Paenibacillus sp. PAMC21692]
MKMKWNFSSWRIRTQFGAILAVSMLLILIIQMIYYFQMTKVTKERVELFTKSSIKQVVDTTDIIFEKVSKAAIYFSYNSYLQTFLAIDDPFEIFQAQKYIEDMITTAVEINYEIENVVILDPALKRKYYYNSIQVSSALDQIETTLREGDGSKGFIFLQGDEIENRDYLAYVMPIVYSAPDARRGENLGTMIIFLKLDALRTIMHEAAPSDEVDLVIVDYKDRVVASNSEQIVPGSVHQGSLPSKPSEGIAIREKIGSTGWNMVGVIKIPNVVKDYEFLKSFSMIVGISMLVLLVLFGLVFHRSFAKPLSRLLDEIRKVGVEDFGKRIQASYQSEIGGIALYINRMLQKLELMNHDQLLVQKRMYQIEISKKQTELYALQSQVNPHFLFNTLQSIGGIAYAKQAPEIVDMTVSMAEIFNYGIKGNDNVTIRDELHIARQYLNIIDIRFNGRFQWEIDVPDALLELNTIKMILQPIVENAVYHGLEKKLGQASLSIAGWLEQDGLCIQVRDNGPGMTGVELARIKQMIADMAELELGSAGRQKIGIANIQWRIRVSYGEPYGLTVDSVEGEGTTVQIRIPILANK